MPTLRPTREDGGVHLGHAALICVQLCFGFMPIFGKWAFQPGGFTPLAVAAWRITVGALVLGLLALLRYRSRMLLRGRDWLRVFGLALLGVAFNQAFYLAGLNHTSAMQAGLLTCLIPVFTFVVAATAGHERFAWPRALGVVVALAGALPLILARRGKLEFSAGAVLLASSSLVYSCYLVFSKPLLRRYPPLVVLTWVYIGSLPAALLFGLNESLLPQNPTSGHAWLALGLILLFPTILAYLLNLYALSRVRASTTATYIYAQPLISAVASALLLGERLAEGMLQAAALLFLGLWLVARPTRGSVEPAALAPKA